MSENFQPQQKPPSASGNILKDSYYKERLINSKAGSMYKNSSRGNGSLRNPHITIESDSADDSDIEDLPAEEQELNMEKILSRFAKTAQGPGYAFLDFICTHKKLKTIKVHFSNYRSCFISQCIKKFEFLENIDLSYNSLKSLRSLSGLKYLTSIVAINNQLTNVLDMKKVPLYLDTVDLSFNEIKKIPSLKNHIHLRVLKLKGNKIQFIEGFEKNPKLELLDLSENIIEEIKGLERVDLKELYLSNNQIEVIKNLQKLQNLRVLDLSINKIKKMKGLVSLVNLRELDLAKNLLSHVREIQYIENLMYLTYLNLSYNPIQERKYYRKQITYRLPMLEKLDGVTVDSVEVVGSENFYGLDTEERYRIFKKHLPEEEFVDRRVFRSELLENETDSDGETNNFVDEYDEEGKMTKSNRSRSKGSKGFGASKRSGISKGSKRSNFMGSDGSRSR